MTKASMLQPIETRRVMLATGLRANFGVKIYGPDLATIEATLRDSLPFSVIKNKCFGQFSRTIPPEIVENDAVTIFDGRFEHEAWNDADEQRIVLHVDFVRPARLDPR